MDSLGGNDHNLIIDSEISSYRFAVIGVCAFLLVFGLVGGKIIPVFCSVFIIFSLIISGFITIRRGKKIKINRLAKQNCAFEKSLMPISITVENASETNILFSQFEDYFPPAGSIYYQISSVDVPFLSQKRYDLKTSYFCGNRRGKYQIGPFKVKVFDPFFFTVSTCSDLQTSDFFVYPRPEYLEKIPFSTNAAPFTIGILNCRCPGPGHDFIGIREYTKFDDPRHIHWPATAKTGSLMLRELEEIGATRFTVFFDLNKEVLAGLGHHTTAEYAIKSVVTIAKFAIDAGHQIQVIAEGDKILFHPFGSGIWHLTPLLQKLCEIRPQGTAPLVELIEKHFKLIPKQSTVIIIMSKNMKDLEKFTGIIRSLHAEEIKINIILIDHTTFLPIYKPHDFDQSSIFSNEIKKLGINVYSVARGDDLVEILNKGNAGSW